MFEVGCRVIRGRDGRSGFIHDMEKQRCPMIEVRWDDTGIKQWLPAEEFRVWDKVEKPEPARVSGNGSTAPAYLKSLRSYERRQPRRVAIEALTENILRLSGKRKNRSLNKVKGLVKQFESGKRLPEYRPKGV